MTDNDNGVAEGLWESDPGETVFEGEIPQRLQDDLVDKYNADWLQRILATICCTMPDKEENNLLEPDVVDDKMRDAANVAADAALLQEQEDDGDNELERQVQAVLA
jgi:hypothetical protein